MSIRGLVFIDANQYLDLYGIPSSQKLLAAVDEQRGHILVTAQVADEVQRRKVDATAAFLATSVKKSKGSNAPINGVVSIRERLRNIRRKVSHDLLEKVSQSKDEVSKALADIFFQAVEPTGDELRRARERKELGKSPGKRKDPLGDQISWEQILSRCKDKPSLWIITKDSDYGTKHEDRMFLNAALYQELALLYRSDPVVFCFNNIGDGLTHFTETTGAKAEKLPTPQETEQIKKEQESLPPIDWLTNYDDSYPLAMRFQDAFRMRDSATLLVAPWLSQFISSDKVIPQPAPKQADEDDT